MPPVGFWGSSPSTFDTTVPSAAKVNIFTPPLSEEEDILIAVIVTPSILPTAVGWETMGTSSSGSERITIFRRRVDESEPGIHSWNAGASSNGLGVMLLYRGLIPDAAIVANGSMAVASLTTHLAPTITVGRYSDVVIAADVLRSTNLAATANMAAGVLRGLAHGVAGGGGWSLAVAELQGLASGGTGSIPFAWSTAAPGFVLTLALAAVPEPLAGELDFEVPGAMGFVTIGV
jgi:hypothetical protein